MTKYKTLIKYSPNSSFFYTKIWLGISPHLVISKHIFSLKQKFIIYLFH